MALLDPIVNLPKTQKIALGAVGLVAVAALGYFFVISRRPSSATACTSRTSRCGPR